MLVVYFSHVVTRRAIVDTSVEHVLYEAVSVALMLAIAHRSHLNWLSMPVAPAWLTKLVPFGRPTRATSVLIFTAITISLTTVVRATGNVVRVLGYSTAGSCDGVADSACCTYNDAACSGDGMVVDIVEVFTAAIGEELAFRYAFLVIVARVAGVRVAVAAQAIVWGLSHTGFDRGYGADEVVGLVAVGIVSAAVVLTTRSVWPAVAAHALHNLGVAALDHDVTVVTWAVTTAYALSAIVSAAVVSLATVRFISRRR